MEHGHSLVIPPHFDENNYAYWKVRMKAFLKSIDKRVWNSIEYGWEKLTTPVSEWQTSQKEAAAFNSKTMNVIFNAISMEEFKKISNVEVAYTAWNILQTVHEGTKAVKINKLQQLTSKFESIRMSNDESFDESLGFSNLSCHIYDSNTLVRSWIRGIEFTSTPRIVAKVLGVPVVTEPVYPYAESPPIDVVMSHITGSSIQWGSDPRITSSALSKIAYLFLRVACHSLWPISHLHTIPLERCVFLYTFMSGVSINFPHLFLRFLNEVHRSSAIRHALIHPIFIHRILLFLGLADFPAGEPVHVVGPLGATCFRHRAAHLRVDPSGPRGASSGDVPPPPSSTGAAAAKTFAAAAADVPPPITSDDSDIRHTLDHVLTVQAAQGQILVDVLDEIHGFEQIWHSFGVPHHHLLLMMDFDCPLAFRHKKGEYI